MLKLFRNRPNPPDPDAYLLKREWQYILTLDRVFAMIAGVPGHIVEVGVARGRNAILFGHMINAAETWRHYYGFDTFAGYTADDLSSSPQLSAHTWQDSSRQAVEARIKAVGLSKTCHLYEGDIRDTGPAFLADKAPGHSAGHFRCALLYVDCNAKGAALAAMRIFHPHMSPEAIICVDEHTQGGETEALMEFCAEAGLTVRAGQGPFAVPAYTVVRGTTPPAPPL